MANLYAAAGQPDKALELRQSNYDVSRVRLGEDHPDTVKAMTNLAASYADAGRIGESLPLAAKAWEFRKARYGSDHQFAQRALDNFSQMIKQSLDEFENVIAEDRVSDARRILPSIKQHLPLIAQAQEFTARLESLETKLNKLPED